MVTCCRYAKLGAREFKVSLPAAEVTLASLERMGLAADVSATWLDAAAGVDLVALLLSLEGPAAVPEDSGCSCSSCVHTCMSLCLLLWRQLAAF